MKDALLRDMEKISKAEIMARRKRADQLRNMPRDELVEWYRECTVEQISHSMRISHKTVFKDTRQARYKKRIIETHE